MAKIEKITSPIEGTYEGKPTLSIPLGSGRPFTFGVEKAASIVKHIEAVRAFSTKYPPRPVDAAEAAKSLTDDQLLAILAARKAA